MPRVQIPAWECTRCGHVWPARGERKPRMCARCHSSAWDKPRAPEKPKAAPKPKPWEDDISDEPIVAEDDFPAVVDVADMKSGRIRGIMLK
ncbi:MAG TPA: hypothetical protein VMD91_06400 [Candidatus Sulfotelmatobacter sp.]|nr:hypothetical protein [Candidatus Sulfotelmatobacter sp.]